MTEDAELKKMLSRSRIYISFFRMHRAAIKKARELGAKSYALFNAMREINVAKIAEELHLNP
jgi:hypothetical protein